MSYNKAIGNVTQRLSGIGNMGGNQWTAVIIWLIGAWLTATTLAQLGVVEPVNYIFGMGIQWILTKAEAPIWQKKGFPLMAVGATAVDVLINAGGAWPPLKNLGKTDFWAMMQDILADKADPNAQPIEPTQMTVIVLAVGVGTFTAAAAEYFWNLP